jgi:hypothetical protein
LQEQEDPMTTHRPGASVTRRTALAGLGAGALGVALATAARPATAQDATAEAMANHPIVGAWMVAAPTGPALAVFLANGINIQGVPTAQAGPQGVTFTGAQVGTWEPVSERGIHFTGVQLLTDATGAFVGSVTIDGHPVVSADGQMIVDDAPETTITVRDAAHNVVEVVTPYPGGVPATGVRMGVGAPGFPEGTPGTATPTA